VTDARRERSQAGSGSLPFRFDAGQTSDDGDGIMWGAGEFVVTHHFGIAADVILVRAMNSLCPKTWI